MTDNPGQFSYYPQQPPQPGVIPLRPLDVGAMIGGSFRAIFRNWHSAILPPFAGCLITSAVGIVPAVNLLSQFASAAAGGRPDPGQVLSMFGTWLLFMLLELVLVIALTVFTQAVVTVAVSRAVLGRGTTIVQALRAAAPRLLPLLGLTALVWLIVFGCAFVPFVAVIVLAIGTNTPGLVLLGLLLFLGGVVAGGYFWIAYALAPAALILEPAPVLTALRRSRWLTKDNWWRAFGVLLLAAIMVYFVSYLAQLPLYGVQFGSMASVMPARGSRLDPVTTFNTAFSPGILILFVVVSAAVYAIGQPFMIGVTTLLYHDLRIRKESFHVPLHQMSQLPDDLSPPEPMPPHPEATT